MTTYRVTSGGALATVTKGGAPFGGPYANDLAAIQAAVNDAASNDVVELKQVNGSTPFEFAGAGGIRLGNPGVTSYDRNLTFTGILTDGERPTIQNGVYALLCWNLGYDLTVEKVIFKNSIWVGLAVPGGKNVTVRECDVIADTFYGRTFYQFFPAIIPPGHLTPGLGAQLGAGIVIGHDILKGFVTGTVLIEKGYFDCEQDPDASPKGVLDRRHKDHLMPFNPDGSPNGTYEGHSWSGFGVYVLTTAKTADVFIKNNLFRNFTARGSMIVDNRGKVSFVTNQVFSRNWIADVDTGTEVLEDQEIGGSYFPETSMSYVGVNVVYGFFDPGVKEDAVVEVSDNKIYALGRHNSVFITYSQLGSEPRSLAVKNNKFLLDEGNVGLAVMNPDRIYLGQNQMAGSSDIGFMIGTPEGDIVETPAWYSYEKTLNSLLIGNDLTKWNPTGEGAPFAIYLAQDSQQCLAFASGPAGEQLLDRGQYNLVSDYNDTAWFEFSEYFKTVLSDFYSSMPVAPSPPAP